MTIGWTNPPAVHSEESTVDFNHDVRGILSDKCFLCHGPDEATREADLRLDSREAAMEAGAIKPGHLEDSELLARITSNDADLIMPPPDSGKSLSQAEIKTLQQWIKQDAPYDKHWAYRTPRIPTIPKSKNTVWGSNEVDAFVLARLESLGLQTSPIADTATLVRRIHLDLIGLPPSIETLDRFQHIESPELLGKLLDELVTELLQSKHFGERWGRWWLDAARYADSAGYEKDMQRQVWFYRDWVVDAMNRDMPYDQFIIEQIAGDLLPGATQSQRVATGFLRNSMTNEEGGADPEQFRVEGMFDRMDAIGKAILGVTTQCAQCHTHKYDPLSHREYYQMFAALNDFHEACISVYTPEQAAQRDHLLASIRDIEEDLIRRTPDWMDQVRKWAEMTASILPEWTAMKPTEVPFEGEKFKVLEDGSIVSESYAPTKATSNFSLTTEVGTITAVRVDALTHPQLPRQGPGRSVDGTGALSEFRMTVRPTAEGAKPITVKFKRAMADVNAPRQELPPQYRERDPSKDERVTGPAEYAIDGDEKTAWTTDVGPGRSNQSRHIIFVPESPIVIDGEARLTFTVVFKHGGWNSDDNQNYLIGRYRFSTTDSETIPDATVPGVIAEILETPAEKWLESQWRELFSHWRTLQPNFAQANKEIESLWSKYPQTATQLVAQSLAKPRESFVYTRGDFLKPTDRVEPAAPEFLHAMPNSSAPDRLRFAKWLVSKDSPTTARVIVNRIWQAYFGRGLVTTPEDFGLQSSSPSHPKLLDFLARELMDNEWSLKHIHRLIVRSATYRQRSDAREQTWRDDPTNEHLARGPRVRVEAEMVRDIALSASGLLDQRIGGPSIYPPAPDFLFQPPTSYGPKIWNLNRDGSQYRRSLYVHQYRSVPYPPLQVFDAPKGDAACVRRERSNSPLQALVLLNEPQFVQAARALASRVLREVTGATENIDEQRIVHAFRLCTSRIPLSEESEVLMVLLRQQRDTLRQDGDNQALESLLGVSPETCRQLTGVDASELAAWMTVCRAILNLDETITKS